MKYLLDTCAISEHCVKRPNPDVINWLNTLHASDTFLSVISIGELNKGIEKLPSSKRKDALEKWLKEDLLIRFDGNIVELTLDVMMYWGELVSRMERQGHPISPMDSLIAAQALFGDFVLVTRNEKDFEHSGVKIVNPWKIGSGTPNP